MWTPNLKEQQSENKQNTEIEIKPVFQKNNSNIQTYINPY